MARSRRDARYEQTLRSLSGEPDPPPEPESEPEPRAHKRERVRELATWVRTDHHVDDYVKETAVAIAMIALGRRRGPR